MKKGGVVTIIIYDEQIILCVVTYNIIHVTLSFSCA